MAMSAITFGKDQYHQNREMEQWCREHIGKGGWLYSEDSLWKIESMFGNTTFTFKHEQDATLFVLKWAQHS